MKMGWVVSTLLGIVLLVGGSWLAVLEVQTAAAIAKLAIAAGIAVPPIHSGHIYFFGSIALLGGLLINPTPNSPAPLFTVIKGIVVVVAPFVPWSRAEKARRASVESARVEPEQPEGNGRGAE